MSKKLKVAALALLVGANITFFSPDVFAQAADGIADTCTQWQQAHGACTPGLRALILTILNWFLLFVGLIATAILIYGGFLYVTSAGNDENVGKAKKLIIYSVVGIIVILMAAVIVDSVLGAAEVGVSASQQ